MKHKYSRIFAIIFIFLAGGGVLNQSLRVNEAHAKDESNEVSLEKLQTQFEEKVTNSLKNYLKTLEKRGYSANTKNLLANKPKNKAQAFCFDWSQVVPDAINDQQNYEIISAGNAWNYVSKNATKEKALFWCNKRPATQTGQCKCEVLNFNGNFSLSPAA